MAQAREHETESDEDEVYFLKPVNEYNIVEKIKEANKELFDKISEDVDSYERSEELAGLATSGSRKVSFAIHLEEYEPQRGINTPELEHQLGKDIEPATTEASKSNLQVISEEEPEHAHDAAAEDTQKIQISCAGDDAVVEEICEEILLMDVENKRTPVELDGETESSSTLQRKMIKQITFDYEDDEQDNNSLTNLLISDNEDGEQAGASGLMDDLQDFNCNESLQEDSTDAEDTRPLTQSDSRFSECFVRAVEDNADGDDDAEGEEEDDDKLSIIVASYLPDADYDTDKASLTSSREHQYPLRSRRLPFNKRFSFKRKTKSSNLVGSSHNNTNCRRFMPPPEVTDLKLHYKACCEFKHDQLKLPHYTGYLSEYGLSREQLKEREAKLQQKQRSFLQQTLRTSEQEIRKLHDNERAFSTWLKNKMRFPINKTRNMFDVRRPFGLRKCTSVAGATSAAGNGADHTVNGASHTTRYRSISATFKKA